MVLYVPRVGPIAGERVEAWHPALAGVREVFHARFVEHAYPPHTHDAWAILVVDEGVVAYKLDRHDHGSYRSVVSVLPPDVVHDGRSARTGGFRKQVLYLEPSVLGVERVGRAVDQPTLPDAGLVRALQALHASLRVGGAGDSPLDPLEAETRLAFVTEALTAHLDRGSVRGVPLAGPPSLLPVDRPAALAAAVRDELDAHIVDGVTLAGLAGQVGTSPTHVVRSFTAAFGIPPHAYLVARRVDLARALLLAGLPPAEVAVAAGFHDQPHLTRHFRRHVGTTPARYASTPGSPPGPAAPAGSGPRRSGPGGRGR